MSLGEKIIPVNIEEEMKSKYIDYSMSVIVSRALPDVRDGLKPVHRRVLYGMYELGIKANSAYKKSARIVGEVLGKFHPHGDTSVYDAMVRMAQEWSLRYMMVDGQGNFGSIDGDNPAAMRYTEARMRKTSEDMLMDIDKETIDWELNFDDTLKEPSVLPARLPNLLLNGTTGIAVGMATNMPPHNLTEVVDGIITYIEARGDINTEVLMEHVKAPDFPTGGIIYGYDGVKSAFETGRGRIVIRGKVRFEETSNKEQIIVEEIPYMVNKSNMIKQTADLVNSKKIDGIADIRDESDRNGMRIVYDLKRDAIPNIVLNKLYKYTSLQSSFSVNNIALVKGRPKLLNLKQLIQLFVAHRHDVLIRKTNFELAQAEKRAHILEGLIIALDNLDAVIELIRASRTPEDARNGLITNFNLSEIQAKAILELRLQKLTGLEMDKIKEEHAEIMQKIKQFQEILNNEDLRLNMLVDDLKEIKEKYGDERRSKIEYSSSEVSIEDMIPNEEVLITISHLGYIKRTSLSEYRSQARGGVGSRGAKTREEDFVEEMIMANNHDFMLFFTERGRCFWLKVYEIPEGSKTSKGRAIQNMINIPKDDKVMAYINTKDLKDEEYINSHYIVMCTKKGVIKKTSLEQYSRPRTNGINAITIREGDQLLEAKMTTGNSQIMMAVKSGKAIRFEEEKVRAMGRTAAGVRGIRLASNNDEVIGMICINKMDSSVLVVAENGYGKRSAVEDYRITNRGGKGVKTINITEKTGNLIALKNVTNDDDIMVINKSGITIRIGVDTLRIMGRATQGVKIIRLKEDDKIASVAKVSKWESAEKDLNNDETLTIEMKKTKLIITSLLFFCLIISAQENTNPILLKEASKNPVDISYEKWQLPNGLTVLIHEDNSDPLVHVHVTYHVGSNRETAGKSGFAHFFEHMMFQGSENVPDEKHFKIINDAGGSMNGNTTYDRTVYFQTIPSNYLETALWLESDRMGFLLDAVTPEKFENQRDAVKNEKYQNQISRQYGMSYEILGQNLYPPSHPYNWPVIGYVDDLDRATLEDLKNFFLRWYGPNNAILTITGDVNSKEVLPLIEKYFGSIPRGAEVTKLRPMVPRLSSDIYASYTDNVYLPLTDIVFPTVPNYHKDEAPLDMLAALMGDGKKSIFYKNFVKSEKAIQAGVSHPCRELSGEFHFTVLSYPDWQEDQGIYFNNIEKDIRNTINEWEEIGFSDEDLEMVKTEMISQSIDMKTSISSKASIISQWEWLAKGKYNISSEIDRYKKVTRSDIMRVFNKYIKNRKAVINQVKPKSPFIKELDSLISRNPNADLILKEDPQYDNLVYNKADSEFDACCRHTQPQPSKPKTPNIPKFYKENFKNGLKTIFSQTDEIPKVYIRLKMNGGSLLENNKKVGTASLTAQMMNESTLNKSSEIISVELQKIGSTINFSSEGDVTILYIESLTENLSKTLEIAKEKLFSPAFNEDDFERIKKSNIEGLESNKKNAQYLARTSMNSILFGETPYGKFITEKSIKKIKLKDIKAYYNNYSPNISELIAVGNITKEDLYSQLDFLQEWKNNNVVLPNNFEFPKDQPTQIYLLEKEGASQSLILMGHKSNTYDVDGIYFKSQIMNKSLGGGASGRLFLNLREDKGYTYGANSFFNGQKETGYFAIQTSVKTEVTDSALSEIFHILENYTNQGITAEELSSTKKSYLNSESLKYETPNQKLRFLNRILTYNLDPTYINKQATILNDMTLKEINTIAASKIKTNEMAIVIVGNTYLIKKKLENLSSKTDGMQFNFKINEIKY